MNSKSGILRKLFCITLSVLLIVGSVPTNAYSGSNSKEKPKKKISKKEFKKQISNVINAEVSFYNKDFESAISIIEPLREYRDGYYALWNNQLGSLYLVKGDYEKASDAFLQAYYLMNDIFAFSDLEKKAVSLFGAESEKAYKGDPYERLYNSLYTGLLLWGQNDLDNALAAFKTGILADSDVEGGAYKSDATLLYLLSARLEKRRNATDGGSGFFKQAKEAYYLSHPTNRSTISEIISVEATLTTKQEELDKRTKKKTSTKSKEGDVEVSEETEVEANTNFSNKGDGQKKESKKVRLLREEIGKLEESLIQLKEKKSENDKQIDVGNLNNILDLNNNLLLILETGSGPVKFPVGKYGHIVLFTFKPSKIANYDINIDGVNISKNKLLEHNDTFYQASTRGGRKMDGILKGQAQFKEATAQIGQAFAQASQNMMDQINQSQQSAYSGTAAAGGAVVNPAVPLIMAGIGLAFTIGSAMANPAADVRHWSLLPGELKVIPLKLPVGQHTIVFTATTDYGQNMKKEIMVDIIDGDNIAFVRIIE